MQLSRHRYSLLPTVMEKEHTACWENNLISEVQCSRVSPGTLQSDVSDQSSPYALELAQSCWLSRGAKGKLPQPEEAADHKQGSQVVTARGRIESRCL